MSDQNREQEITRRDLGALLGILSGAAGAAVLASCANEVNPAISEEDVGVVDEALTGLSNNIRWVDTVAALRALTGTTNQIAILESYATVSPNDGGGGLFVWSTVAGIDDGGTFLNSLGQGNSRVGWRRIYSDALNVKWFGATGLGTVNDAPAINAAIAAKEAAGGGTVYIPRGLYRCDSTIDFGTAPCVIKGDGWEHRDFSQASINRGTYLRSRVQTGPAFTIGGITTPPPPVVVNIGVKIRDLALVNDVYPTNRPDGLKFVGGARINVYLENILFAGFNVGFDNGPTLECVFRDLLFMYNTVALNLGNNNNQWYNCNFQQNTTAISASNPVANHRFYGGIVEANTYGIVVKPAVFNLGGIVLGTLENVVFDGLWFENNQSHDVVIDVSNETSSAAIRVDALEFRSCHMNAAVISFIRSGSNQHPSTHAKLLLRSCINLGSVSLPSWSLCSVIDSTSIHNFSDGGTQTTIVGSGFGTFNKTTHTNATLVPGLIVGPDYSLPDTTHGIAAILAIRKYTIQLNFGTVQPGASVAQTSPTLGTRIGDPVTWGSDNQPPGMIYVVGVGNGIAGVTAYNMANVPQPNLVVNFTITVLQY